MNYIPNTDADRALMLEAVGVDSTAELFRDVPEQHRFPTLNLPPALSEMEVLGELNALANENDDLQNLACFLGAGAYHHFVPSVVDFILHRSEFFTAYTPYQPEVSQGTLQAHFEYQIDDLRADRHGGQQRLALRRRDGPGRGGDHGAAGGPRQAQQGHPRPTCTRSIARWCAPTRRACRWISSAMARRPAIWMLSPRCVESRPPASSSRLPTSWGGSTPRPRCRPGRRRHAAGALFVVSVDPIAWGSSCRRAQYGADVVVGEGQPLGNGISFGGPYLGFFAMKAADVRRSAGRIVGQTVDVDGKRGYVLTLSTREQHIRREKATSNICTNQALNALAAAIYMAAMGKYGLRTSPSCATTRRTMPPS